MEGQTPDSIARAITARDQEARLFSEITGRKVCSWCRRILRAGSEPTSHGICPMCVEQVTVAPVDPRRI